LAFIPWGIHPKWRSSQEVSSCFIQRALTPLGNNPRGIYPMGHSFKGEFLPRCIHPKGVTSCFIRGTLIPLGIDSRGIAGGFIPCYIHPKEHSSLWAFMSRGFQIVLFEGH